MGRLYESIIGSIIGIDDRGDFWDEGTGFRMITHGDSSRISSRDVIVGSCVIARYVMANLC